MYLSDLLLFLKIYLHLIIFQPNFFFVFQINVMLFEFF